MYKSEDEQDFEVSFALASLGDEVYSKEEIDFDEIAIYAIVDPNDGLIDRSLSSGGIHISIGGMERESKLPSSNERMKRPWQTSVHRTPDKEQKEKDVDEKLEEENLVLTKDGENKAKREQSVA